MSVRACPSDAAVVVRARIGVRGVRVGPSTMPGARRGLFAGDCAFEQGEIITRYEGLTLRLEEARRRAVQTHMASLSYGLVVSGLRQPMVGRGGGSFANDCPGRYNAEKYTWLGQIFLRATRRISPGEEVFWPYGAQGFEVAMGRVRL